MKLSLLCILALLVVSARADYIQLEKKSFLYATASTRGEKVAELAIGEQLILEAQQPTQGTFYAARSTSGRLGWVPRTHVRRYEGNLPGTFGGKQVEPWADIGDDLTDQQKVYARKHYSIGKPQAVIQRVYEGYASAHDSRLKIPVWVQYELNREQLDGPANRKDDFRPDYAIPPGSRSELSDYAKTGYDRGHLAAAEDMSRSSKTMSESFFLSNMTPQVGVGFNQHIWADLEAAIRGWVVQRGTLTIITGPIFAKDSQGRVSYETIGANGVAVPTHFFKVVVDAQNSTKIDAIAFILPNADLRGHKLDEYLVSIDAVEQATGIDLLSSIPITRQNELEKVVAKQLW